jgi:YVTN family beta-propeller protein
MSPAGDRVYVTNSDSRSVSVIDVNALREVTRINLNGLVDGPFGIAVSPDGQTLYASDIGSAQIFVVDTDIGNVTGQISVLPSPRSIAVSPDGATLYVSGFEGSIGVVDVGAGREVERISTPSGVFRVAFSPDGSTVYATDQDGSNLLVIDALQRRLTRTVKVLPTGSNTRGIALSPDGDRIYVTNANSNDLVVFDATTLSVVANYKLGDGPRGIVIRKRPFADALPASTVALSDFDSDGLVGFSDFLLFAIAFGTNSTDSEFDSRFDLDGSGAVDFADFLSFAQSFGRSALN